METQQQSFNSMSNKRPPTLNLFSPENSSIKDFINNIESKIIPHGHEKAFKSAIYNGLALTLILICSVTCYAVFLILEPFLKPLLWALICGTVLHPMKKIVSNYLKKYVNTMQSYSMLIQTIFVPILFIDSVSDAVGTRVQYLWNFQYMIHIISGIVGTFLVYLYIPSIISIVIYLLSTIIHFIDVIVDIFQHFTVILLLVILYITLVIILLNNQSGTNSKSSSNQSESNSKSSSQSESTSKSSNQSEYRYSYELYMKIFSVIIWFALCCYFTSFFGSYVQPILLIFVQFIFAGGFLYQYYFISDDQTQESTHEDNNTPLNKSDKNIIKKVTKRSQSDSNLLTDPSLLSNQTSPSLISNQFTSTPSATTSLTNENEYCDHTSDSYIYWVICFCMIAAVLQNLYLLFIFILFEILYLIKKMCLNFGLKKLLNEKFQCIKTCSQDWFRTRQDVIFPKPLNGIRKMNIQWRKWCLSMFKESSDALASVLVIFTLIFILIFGTVFFAIQAYAETFHMIKIGGNIINQTVVHNPELLHFLPDGWENTFDSVLNNTYTYGRVGISKMVFSTLEGMKKEKVLEFEKTALELWDRIYQAWLMSAVESNPNLMGPKVTYGAVSQTWSHFIEHVQKTPELMNSKTMSTLMNNMTMLSSGLESVWVLIKANIGLVLQALTTLVSLVFGSGFAVLNFFINIVVFLTALFYLLSSSGKLYKPVQIITSVSPIYGNKLAVAIETAVHEVLTASFKLALFYGLWTWLIHNLFQVQLVYIPSAIASILAAVPVLGPYWACIPGVLDLYFAQESSFKAISLMTFQILPSFFVDTAIFNEIQGGHPYLTGLSVAGGVFWLGIEGAIIGPLLLCCLFVIVNLSTSIMRENVHSLQTTPDVEKYSHSK